MGQIAMALPPTLIWQQFETLTKDVVAIHYNDPDAHAYGNPGSAQNGVDVYCNENSNGRLIGVQCKRLGKTDSNGQVLAGGLKMKHIDEEIKKAESFKQPLDHYVLATTDSRRTELQDYAIEINVQRKSAGKFTFDIWFWEDYLGHLHQQSNLLEWYYSNVLQLKGVYSFEHQILYLIQMAFSRPAFTTPIHREGGNSELIDALKDTEKALNTGQLKDRETKGVLRVAPGGFGMINTPAWHNGLVKVHKYVKEARAAYNKAKKSGKLAELPDQLVIHDPAIATHLDNLRGDAVRELNNVLKDAGLNEIQSPL